MADPLRVHATGRGTCEPVLGDLRVSRPGDRLWRCVALILVVLFLLVLRWIQEC